MFGQKEELFGNVVLHDIHVRKSCLINKSGDELRNRLGLLATPRYIPFSIPSSKFWNLPLQTSSASSNHHESPERLTFVPSPDVSRCPWSELTSYDEYSVQEMPGNAMQA